MITRRPLAVAVVGLALIAAACGDDSADNTGTATTQAATATEAPSTSEAAAAAFPMTIENCGRDVVFDAPPERVLTIGTVAVNLIHAAGGSHLIASRAGEFGTPAAGEAGEAVSAVPILLDEDPGLEAILGTGVDTVIGYGLFETTEDDLAASGVRSLTVSGNCGQHGGGQRASGDLFDLVLDDIRTYGQLFGTSEVADATVADLEAQLAAVEPLEDAGTAAALYWFFSDDPSAYGNQSMAHAIFERLGIEHVFADQDSAYFDLSIEALLDADPDTIVLVHDLTPDVDFDESLERLKNLPGAADLSAVKNNRIVGISYVYMETDPAAVDGLKQLAEAIGAL
jgi:iron complex transport system substrate-binding protein